MYRNQFIVNLTIWCLALDICILNMLNDSVISWRWEFRLTDQQIQIAFMLAHFVPLQLSRFVLTFACFAFALLGKKK